MFSLHTSNWQLALKIIRDMEVRGYVHERDSASSRETEPKITLEEACKKFVEAQKGHVSPDRIKRYERLFRRMQEFGFRANLLCMSDFNLEALTDFVVEGANQWRQRSGTVVLNIQMLRKFFGFGQKREWVKDNPAKGLEMPKSKRRPTLPFTAEEWRRILAAFPLYEKRAGGLSTQRLYAFVLLLRYSGMRIGDAVRCETNWFENDRISFDTEKNNVRVRNKLPSEVIEALTRIPLKSDCHFFWTGMSSLHSAVGKWQRRLRVLFDLAGVRDGHAHRFRDSFAFDMTQHGGMTLEELRQALGHKTTRTTEKFYSHWLQDRQDRLEAKQERAWARQSALPALGGKEDRPI